MSEENKSPAPTKEGLEERAEKYIAENNEWMFDQNHFHITRSFVNTILRQAYIAGAQSSLQPVDELALEAMDFYWRHLMSELWKENLGDIERENYENLAAKLIARIFKINNQCQKQES